MIKGIETVKLDINKTLNNKSFMALLSSPKALIELLNISIYVNVFIVLLVAWLYINPKQPDYFSTSYAGKTEELVAINQPNSSDYAILQWANTAAVSAFTYDFVNYDEQLQQVSQYFTDEGWDAFMSAIQDSDQLQQVVYKKLIVNAVATHPPIILQKGELNGVYSWRIQIPLLVTYQAAGGFVPENILITMLVSRISTLDSYKGVGIQQFITSGYDITETQNTVTTSE